MSMAACSKSKNLHGRVPDPQGSVMRAVEGVSLTLEEGEVLGIVGESGSGKSVTMLALMGLSPAPGRVRAKTLRFDGQRPAGHLRPASAAAWSARTWR